MPRDDREQNFDKALARNLRSSFAAPNPSAPSEDCLDAEILAAYHDRLLDPEEMASRKSHIAGCERCQEILAQLEATDEIPVEADRDLLLDAGAMATGAHEVPTEDLSVPVLSAATPASAPTESAATLVVPGAARKAPVTITTLKPAPSLERPKMVRWVALAGALAAGILLWIVFRERTPQSFQLAKNQQQRSIPDAQPQPPSTAPAPSAAPAAADSISPPLQQSQPAQQSQKSESRRADALNSPASLPKSNTSEVSGAVAGTAGAPALQKKERTPEQSLKPLQTPARATNQKPAAVVEDSAIAMAAKLPPDGLAAELKRQLDLRSAAPKATSGNAPAPSNPGEVLPATPPPVRAKVVPDYARDSAAPEPQSALTEVSSAPSPVVQMSTSGRALTALAPLSVPAPGGTTLWRIGRAGMIQRSSDSGATWSIQPSGIIADLLAGSAYNDQVCWLVGRAGTILRTTDGGATWQKITAPTNVDLVSIFAINAQSATITDDAAHSFQTSSAGARWSRTILSPR